jgi:hypothetical protein
MQALQAKSHARDKKYADIDNKVGVKNTKPGRVNAHLSVVCSTGKLPENQTAEIVEEQSRYQILQKL